MPFKKGVSGNPSGRKPGLKNKSLSTKMSEIYNENKDRIKKDLEEMTPYQRVSTLIDLAFLSAFQKMFKNESKD